jgi:hypothetical protein
MADTAAIVNLMRHAADRLAVEDTGELYLSGARAEHRERVASVGMAMTYAEAILRTVAAVLDESNDPEVTDV